MSLLAEKIMQAMRANIDDEGYLAEKEAELERLDTLGAAWAVGRLDATNTATLAELLGVTVEDLRAFNRVMQRI